VELSDERLREALLARCRVDGIEPPGRLERIVRSARAAAAERFCAATVARLDRVVVERLEALAAEDQDEAASAGRGRLAELKADPGRPSLETLLAGVDKLGRLRRWACRRGCLLTRRSGWWRRGGRGLPRSTPRICAPARSRSG
jgi:hypothetical protein